MRLIRIFTLLVIITITNFSKANYGDNEVGAESKEAEQQLIRAIDANDSLAVQAALSAGADINLIKSLTTSPIIYAIARNKDTALKKLLEMGANPNITDKENNALSLAVETYKNNHQNLKLLLEYGGNPNTLSLSGEPNLAIFLNQYNHDGGELLISFGADINVRNRSGDPLILVYGLTDDWDNVWFLLEHGAKFDYPEERIKWQNAFNSPHIVSPHSPIWPYKVKVWQYLKKKEVTVPDHPEALVHYRYYAYLDEEGIKRPAIEELIDMDKYQDFRVRAGLEKLKEEELP